MGMMIAKLKLLQQYIYIGYFFKIISIILLKLWKLSSIKFLQVDKNKIKNKP